MAKPTDKTAMRHPREMVDAHGMIVAELYREDIITKREARALLGFLVPDPRPADA